MFSTRSLIIAAFLLNLFPGQAWSNPEPSQWRATSDLSLEELASRHQAAPIPSATGPSTDGSASPSLLGKSAGVALKSLATGTSLGNPPTAVISGNEADEITEEISELARGLQYDPLRIFHFVRNRIALETYYGCKKGAHLTLLEMGGNDVDQAALFVALLRASGISATYQAGPVAFTYDFISQWTGIENPYGYLSDEQFATAISTPSNTVSPTDPDLPNLRKQFAVQNFFYVRGYPIAERVSIQSGIGFGIPLTWVRFNDDGTTRNLSPAIKSHDWSSGIDPGTPAMMSKQEILTEAGGQASVFGNAWIRGIDYTKLSDLLSTYTTRFQADLKANHDGKAMDEIVSTRRIVPADYADLGQAPQIGTYAAGWSSFETWDGAAIPQTRMSKLAVIAGSGIYDYSTDLFASQLYSRIFDLPVLSGKKLSLSFSNNTATISQNDAVAGPSTFTVPTDSFQINLKVIHPHYYLSYSNGTYSATLQGRGNQDGISTYRKGDDNHYTFARAFGDSRKLLRKRQEVLDKYRREGIPETDPRLKTEALNVMGLGWFYQTWSHDRIASGYLQTLPLFHHRIGRVAQENSYYIDVMNQHYTVSNRSMNPALSKTYIEVASATQSAMEHGVIEQIQGEAAVSTARMVYIANLANDRIFRTTTSTWNATKNQLFNYPATTLANLDAAMAPANTVGLVTEVGNRGLNDWVGSGYAIAQPGSIAMKIEGGIAGGVSNGGFITHLYRQLEAAELADMIHYNPSYLPSAGTISAIPYQISPFPFIPVPATGAGGSTTPAPFTAQISPQQASWDPIDMLSGAYFLDKTDMSSGGMAFQRHYHSHQRYQDAAGLGYGWTHGHHMLLNETTSLRGALGEVNAYQAASQLIAALASNVVQHNHTTAREWTVSMLITHWAVEQMQANGVAVTAGNRTIEFVKMPDGSFVPPPGMNLTLTKSAAPSPIYTMSERHGSTWVFDAEKRISAVTDSSGNTSSFNYNGTGELTTVTDNFNHTYTYTWDGGKISEVSDGTGRTVGFDYDSGDLTSVTDPEGKEWTYQYDAEHRLTSMKDPQDRLLVESDYDSHGRVIRQKSMGDPTRLWHYAWSGFLNIEEDPQQRVTGFHYDARGRSTGVTDPLGNRSHMAYDGQDRIISATTPEGEQSVRVWNADNNLVSETDSENHITSYFYDPLLRVQRVTDKRGKDTTFTWSAAHRMLTRTDPLGHAITFAYDGQGNIDSITDAENRQLLFDYDAWGQLDKTTFPDGKFQSLVYNGRGNLLTATDPEGRTVTFTWNKRGQLLTTTLPTIVGQAAAVATNTYDDSGNLQSSEDSNGNVTSHAWNAIGNPTTSTLPALPAGDNTITTLYDTSDLIERTTNSLGHAMLREYDLAHRMDAVTDPLNRRSEMTFDGNGRPLEATDPLNRITEMVWTPRGEIDRIIDGESAISDYGSDENGNQTDFVNRRGKTYTQIYDDANRVTSSTTPTGKTTEVGYFDNNLLETVEEPSGQTTTFGYDSKRLVSTKSDPKATVLYGYDNSGLLKTVTEGADVISRTYDDRGKIKTYTNADGDQIQYKLDGEGNLTRLTYPDGKQVHYTYNARNLLKTVTDWNNRMTIYSYDRLGRLSGITRPNETSATFDHDAGSQLTAIRETTNGKLFSYLRFDHDPAGQIESRLRAPLVYSNFNHPTFTGTYDDDNRLATVNGQAVVLDADSNMTSGPIREDSGNITLNYNSRNQLTAADGLAHIYDAEGHRRTSTDASGTTRYTIDANANLSRLLVKHAPDGSKTYYVYGIGLLYEVDESENTKTHHYDQVGSTILRTDDSGKVIGRAEYSAYGLLAQNEGDMDTPFLYNGQWGVQTDTNGLLCMRARYYSPYLMRFLNADPIGFSGGSNWFAYADGNPISNSDPFGLWSWTQTFGVLKAVGGVIEVTAGAGLGIATGWTGVGAVGGGLVAVHGLDTLQSGIRQAITGNVTDTFTSQGLQQVGVNRTAANLIDTGISIVGTVGASATVSSMSRARGLVHLTDDVSAAAINQSQTLMGRSGIYAGPASNAAASGVQLTAKTFLNPGTYSAVNIPAVAQGAFAPIRSFGGPIQTWQALTGQAAARSGSLNLANGILTRSGINYGQATFGAIDGVIVGTRVIGSLK